MIYILRGLLCLHLKHVKADWRVQIHERILMHALHAPDFKFPRATNEEIVADLFFFSDVVFYFFFFFFSQATGIVFILICQVLEVPRKLKDSKCLKKTEDGKVADFKFAMYFMSAAAVAMAILLICTFKPTYKRLEMERKKEATRILNTETAQQRLPDIPDSSSDWVTFLDKGGHFNLTLVTRLCSTHSQPISPSFHRTSYCWSWLRSHFWFLWKFHHFRPLWARVVVDL